MNLLDIIIIGYVLLQLYLGYTRGAVKSLLNLFGYFATAIITYMFYQPFKKILIDSLGLDKAINQFVGERLMALGASSMDASVSQSDLSAMAKLPLPKSISDDIMAFLTSSAKGVTETVTTQVTDFIITVISIVILFLAIMAAVRVIGSMLNGIVKLPVIRSFNHLFGIIFGIVKTYIVLSISMLILVSLLSMNNWDSIQAMVDSSFLTNLIIQNNVFLVFFSYLA